jgi:N-acetylmuramoyl-L-alanine amidase/Bacterial SH3 domain
MKRSIEGTAPDLEDFLSPFASPPLRGERAGGTNGFSGESSPFLPEAGSWPEPVAEEEPGLSEAEEETVEADEEEEEAEEEEGENWEAEDFEAAPETGEVEDAEAGTFEAETLERIIEEAGELGRLATELERAGEALGSAPTLEADIGDVINLGKHLGNLGSRIGSALGIGPASVGADVSAAVPPFGFMARLAMPAPLLSAAASAKAIQWNTRHHPGTSGVNPTNLRTDLARYVNFSAVAMAIQQFNSANPTAAIAPGTPPVDAVFVEAVHQFQAKCFFETGQIDGMAGESTLDSLGLVKRTGMNTVDRRNAGAHRRLGQVDVAAETNGEFTPDTWFDHMVNPSFLGWRFTTGRAGRGVHLSFIRKLRKAELALLAQAKFSGKTPVELGKALGFSGTSEEHKGARPTATSASMHTYGLAVDIKYTGNPWVRGGQFLDALKRAALLMSGERITQTTSQRFLHNLGSDANLTTGSIYDILAQRNRDFRDYLALGSNAPGLTAALQRRRAAGTQGVFTSATESIADAAARWQRHIAGDLANMRAAGSPFRSGATRDPLRGFLDLDRDLVIALRDTACLAWGAVDIGSGNDGSGDMMHFDDRVCGIGGSLADVGGNTRPRSGHPCVGCGTPAPTTEVAGPGASEFDEREAASAEDETEEPRREELFGDLGNLLNPGAIVERARALLGAGGFGLSLLGRFGAGQVWNEDHLALEVLFERQPTLRPKDLDKLPEQDRLRRLRALAIKHQTALKDIRERVVRPVFGQPASFQITTMTDCRIQDLRDEVRRLGPLKGGEINGKVWYKRSAGASPRKQAVVDSIVVHHMAYNIGNNVRNYLKVGAHYAVLADGQVAQLYDDLDFLNAANGFNARSISIEFAGNFPTEGYHWWKGAKQTIPDRCFLTPAQISAGRCLLATLKSRLPGIRYLYAHRQSSASRENDPGPDVWYNIGEWAIGQLGLTDRLPRTHIGDGRPIPDAWRRARQASGAAPAPTSQPSTTPRPSVTGSPASAAGAQLVVTADALNVRATPSVQGTKVGSLKRGEVVTPVETSADGRWIKLQRGSLVGWSAREYLAAQKATGPLAGILGLVAGSELARYRWRDRGLAPAGYVKGMALVFARAYCKLKGGDAPAQEMARASSGNAEKDALAHYAPEFAALGMRNDVAGVDTLRNLFVLLIGLGMRESSGRHCAGRDLSASNTSADTAEAGLFQTSYNARKAHPVMVQLFRQYSASPTGFEDVFREGVRCKPGDLEDFGSGDGREFQRLSKTCPAFAAEFAAVGLRNVRKHWGPINRKAAELRPECDALLRAVQQAVDAGAMCPLLT